MSEGIVTTRPPRKRRTRKATSERRQQILDAALKCFLQHGISDTTIEQIRIESGASAGSIYHLFKGKNEIALTLYVEALQAYHSKVMSAVNEKSTAQGVIRAMIATHLRGAVDNPDLTLFGTRMNLVSDTSDITEQYQRLNDEFSEAVWQHLKPFVESGELIQLKPELYYSLIIGPTAHVTRSWLGGRISFDLLATIDDFSDAAYRSLSLSACDKTH